MKLLTKIILTLAVMATSVISQVNYFGSTGYNFTPSAWINKAQPYGIAADVKMKFFGAVYTIPSKDLEIGLASTMGWTGDDGYEQKTFVVPIIPSVKLGLIQDQNGSIKWANSVGINLPYGLYNATSVHMGFPFLQPEFSMGVGMPNFSTIYVFGASQIMIANNQGEEYPFGVTAEGAYGTTAETLSSPLEAYFALGTVLKLGRNLSFTATYRKDPVSYEIQDENAVVPVISNNQNKDGEVRLRLIWMFNGIKNATKRGEQ